MTDLLNGIPRVDPTSKPTMMRSAVARMLATTTGSAIHRMFIAPLDNRLMHLTDGRVHGAKGTIPLVLLRTSGARSGVERDVPLAYWTNYSPTVVATAAATDGTDHDRLFALVERYASNFTSYAARTNGIRTIPLLRLTPEGH
jgi:hypothetical protein